MKWLLASALAVALLMIAGLLYLVRPKVRDRSQDAELAPFLHTALHIARPAEIWTNDLGTRLVAYRDNNVSGVKRTRLAMGTSLSLDAFYTTENRLAGIVHLEARGSLTLDGHTVSFVYQWSRVPSETAPNLPLALWQADATPPLRWSPN